MSQNLQTIISRYNAEVISGPDNGFYWIKVDMTTINLSDLESNLRLLNSRITDPDFIISTAGFANVESARTFALVAELLASNMAISSGFNPISETDSIRTQENPGFSTAVAAQNAWWLNAHSTRVIDAWDHTMGFNIEEHRPVQVAVIDAGFAGLSQALQQSNNELSPDQIIWSQGFSFREGAGIKNWTQASTFNASLNYLEAEDFYCNFPLLTCANTPLPHGTNVISIIASRVNNGEGIAGVAPQAQIIPIKVGNGRAVTEFELSEAIKVLRERITNGLIVDVVTYSLSATSQNYALNWASRLSLNPYYFPRLSNTQALSNNPNHPVIFISSAGNSSWNANSNMFGGSAMQGSVLTIGGLEDGDESNANPLADLSRFLNTPLAPNTSFDHGSNYGSLADVSLWAPGKKMFSYGALTTGSGASTLLSAPGIRNWSGTSAATPLVTGVVALLKAKNIHLNVATARAILQNSANKKLNVTDSFVRTLPSPDPSLSFSQCGLLNGVYLNCGNLTTATYDMYMVDAKAAMLSAGYSLANTFIGTLRQVGLTLQLVTPTSQVYTLSWGGITDANKLTSMYVQNDSPNPNPPFNTIGELMANQQVVEVNGEISGAIIHFSYVRRTGQLPPPSNRTWTLKMFNLNDKVEVFINGVSRIVETTATGGSITDITGALNPTNNEIRFLISNLDSNQPFFFLPFPFAGISTSGESVFNGSSWSIELLADNQIIYRDIRGNNSLSRNTGIPQFGARRGDFSMGPVYDQSVYVNKDGSPPFTGTDYQLRVYNVSDISRVTLNNSLVAALDSQSGFETFYPLSGYMNSGNNTFNFKVLTAANTSGTSYPHDIAPFIVSDPNFPIGNLNTLNQHLQNQRQTYTWGFDVYRAGQLIYRNRDGERENLDVGAGNFRSFPSGGEYNTKETNIVEEVVTDNLLMFIP